MQDGLGGHGRVAVVGGTSDLARAVVDRLVAAGTRSLVLTARRPEDLHADAARYRAAGATDVQVLALDLEDPGAADGFLAALRAGGDVDVVLFAAGVLPDEAAPLHEPEVARRAITTNFVGAVPVLAGSAALLHEQGHGTLVVLSSVAGQRARADNPAYAASKAGLDAYASGLGLRLGGSGAKVVVVRPGYVHTKMTEGRPPAPFATTADRVADDTIAGLRAGTPVVWSPGVLRWVFAVLRHLPTPLWARLSERQG